jgi:hypothetical protein
MKSLQGDPDASQSPRARILPKCKALYFSGGYGRMEEGEPGIFGRSQRNVFLQGTLYPRDLLFGEAADYFGKHGIQ